MNKKTPTFLIYCVDCDLQAAVMTGPFFSSSPILKPFLYRLVLGTVKNVLTNHHKQAHIHTHTRDDSLLGDTKLYTMLLISIQRIADSIVSSL